MFLPDVERDRHHRVEHDRVREEDEQRDDGRAAQRILLRGGDLLRPRQPDGELLPGERLPHAAGDGAEEAHAHQEEHNLK